MRTKLRVYRALLLMTFVCLVSACDGGLFGTGDGQPILVEIDDSSGQFAGADIMPSGIENGSMPTTVSSFDNLQVGTSEATPLVNVINVSSTSVVARIDTNNIFSTPIEAGTFTQGAPLQLGENTLVITDANTSDEIFSLRPLNVGLSSLTTLVVTNNTTQGQSVITLSSISMSLTPSIAQLRIVQTNLLSNEDSTASFSLQPSGDSPGSAEVIFSDVSVASSSEASYQAISSGDYILVDSLARIEVERLSLQAGKIYTLIVGQPISAILLHEDDLIAR